MHIVPLLHQHAGYIHRNHHHQPDTHIYPHTTAVVSADEHTFLKVPPAARMSCIIHIMLAASPRICNVTELFEKRLQSTLGSPVYVELTTELCCALGKSNSLPLPPLAAL